MSRQQGTAVVNNFIGGLVTEAAALKFPENACTDTFNCVFDETGRISRRLGFDLEEGYEYTSVTEETAEAFTEFLWQSVAGDGDKTFVVQQQGSTLRFFDVSESTAVSDNNTGLTIDLDSHLATGGSLIPAQHICQYASGTGRLLVVNKACDPIYIEYEPGANTVTATEINLKIRDFIGLSDGLTDGERPAGTVAALITNNPSHYYNILNQSWFIADALSQWDAARTDLPSNRDYVAASRGTVTDSFDPSNLNAQSPGTRLASKGHFIISAWCPDHTQTMSDEGFTATIANSTVQISQSSGSIITDFDLRSSEAFDGDTTQTNNTGAKKSTSSSGYIGKTYSQSFRISHVIVHGSEDQGFHSAANPSVTIKLYGKQGSAPTSGTDGTEIGTLTFTDTGDESAGRTVTSTNTSTFWDHVWVNIVGASGTDVCVAELRMFAIIEQEAIFCTAQRPQCIEFFAGRAWFAGIDFGKLNSKLYFSQIVEKADQFGRCYQANDPASEDFTDLLPDDGGVINIPEIATVKRLFAYQSALLVFATNGVWMITGGSQGGFLATDFVVKKLSSEGTRSPLSFLSYKGVPAWWGDDGIYTVQFDANYQSFNVVSITDEKIKSFINDIPPLNRIFVKGVFDHNNAIGYWLYSDEDDITEYYVYNAVLTINGLSGAFSPWEIGQTDTGPEIRGGVYVINPSGNNPPVVKFTTTIDDGSTERLTYSQERQTTYKDWSMYAADSVSSSEEVDYTSYFITGYRLEGQAIRFFQPNYIIVYHEDDDNCASCFVQGIYDFTTSGDSGKWSTSQQCFNNCLRHRNVNYARLKIRGKGRALQLKFTSESGRPFTIIGWALWITGNSAV